MTELKMKEMQLINWFGCPNLIYTRERIHLVAMLTTDEEMKKNLYRVCRFLAREEIAYRYPIMYEMIRKIFSPDDTNPPEACAMFMPDDETEDINVTVNRKRILFPVSHSERVQSLHRNIFTRE